MKLLRAARTIKAPAPCVLFSRPKYLGPVVSDPRFGFGHHDRMEWMTFEGDAAVVRLSRTEVLALGRPGTVVIHDRIYV